ncbi:MAG: glycosyltransferase [Cyclobacteriaceae bacterium]
MKLRPKLEVHEQNPLISVIIPVFNRETLIREAIESVLSQSYTNWECIVVDDGSTDGTKEVVKGLVKSSDKISFFERIREPKGAPTCRNIGIEHAKGNYLQFLDSDDVLLTDKLKNQVEILKKADADLGLIFNVIWIKARYWPLTIIGFTTISGVMAFLIGRILKIKFIGLNIEPHSRYMMDFSIWSEKSARYRLLRFLENRMTRYGDRIAVPTRGDQERILKEFSLDVDFVPSCIDVEDFCFSEKDRNLIRTELGIDDTFKIIIYVGKFGGIYFEIDEISEYLSKMEKNAEEKICFVVISPMDSQAIRLSLAEKGVKDFRVLSSVPFERLSSYLSSADAGILILPEYASQQFRCPIKTANYLASGLPIIVNKSVGDEADLVLQNKVGWVLDLEAPSIDFSKIPGRKECINLVKKERNIQKVVEYLEDCIV